MCRKLKQTWNFIALVRENQLSLRKTTPARLTYGVQRTKNIVRITCGTYLIRFSALDTKYTIFSYWAIKWILLPRAEQTNPFFDPLVEKNVCDTGKTLILLVFPTGGSKNGFFAPHGAIKCTLWPASSSFTLVA